MQIFGTNLILNLFSYKRQLEKQQEDLYWINEKKTVLINLDLFFLIQKFCEFVFSDTNAYWFIFNECLVYKHKVRINCNAKKSTKSIDKKSILQ